MRKFILALVFISSFISTNTAQTPVPTPVPVETDDVVKISTTLIQVDVTVTDKNGKIITDLKPEDFEVFENGERQNITNFSFVSAAQQTDETEIKPKKTEKNSVPLPPVPLRPGQIRRTIALVVDDLGLSFESIYQVRRALRKFVDEQMQPNDLVAIIRTGSGMGALQQFTSDRRQLYAAIEAVKWNSLGRAGISAFAPIQATLLEQQAANGEEVSEEELAEEQKRLRDFDNFREDIFSVGTLGAINFIVKGMSELPGRKSIMLFSDGFVICTPDSPDRCIKMVESVKQLTDLSNRAAVSIYTFDARGLSNTGISAADNMDSVNPERIRNISGSRSAEIFDKQEGLAFLAEETGGRSFFNNNDINKGLDKALEDQKGYYLIGYQPDDETFDAKTRRFNKLEIKVKRKETNVRFRSGFFGIADNKIKKPETQNPAQQIFSALNSPFAVSDISLRLNTLFGNDKQNGSFVLSLLHVNARDLKFTDEPDGKKKAVFDVLAVSFGENGSVIDQIGKTYNWSVKSDVYQKLLNEGFVYHFTFPVKKPGAYQYRVAIRDSATGKVGSANQFIEIPDLRKNRLTISSIVLENLTAADWQKLNAAAAPTQRREPGNSMSDTSLRQFKRGTVLRYGYEVYNAKLDPTSQKPNLSAQAKIFRDGKPIFEGSSFPIEFSGQTDFGRIIATGAVSLGGTIQSGDYVLQIVVTDNLAKKKRRVAAQFVQFEIE
jgi:VWFA-related protein